MAEESVHKCSQCGNDGHNSRTCSVKIYTTVKLFGVSITQQESPILTNNTDDSSSTNNNTRVRIKRGTAWTEEEHTRFLIGLEKIGKGNWKRISEEYVRTRSCTQVASHAQKYFFKQVHVNVNRRRRISVFDKTLGSSSSSSTLNYSDIRNSTQGSNSYHTLL